MNRFHPLAAAGSVAAAVAAGVLMLCGARFDAQPTDDPPLGAVLSERDRRDLDAPDVRRGAPAPPVDPSVDLSDPDAVARAYLTAAYGHTADDAGHTHLRAAGYAVPGSPPATVGVLVLDPPPPGSVRTASVRALELVTADRADRRRGYLAAVEIATGPPGHTAVVGLVTSNVVLARQPDGRWLVAADGLSDQEAP